ncbi:MAG: YmdB family metallophosphoesterase [Erysipelotrichaceae bacterium]|jgi:metallophosphoesterase (TIGR00282 family)|nr:YmdB family metallophosphoesterase [Erysipelotrichaceae bacterium]
MRVLCLGDVVGHSGVSIVKKLLSDLIKKYDIDFVIANGENAAPNGRGIGPNEFESLLNAGVDVITLGNHYNRNKEFKQLIGETNLVLPLNLLNGDPKEGSKLYYVKGNHIRVTSILKDASAEASVVHEFLLVKEIIENNPKCIHIIDFHAEYTGDKKSFGYLFDGQISAMMGTHTHVQTRDYQILPRGTGYITDLGMCGDYESILGFEKNSVINKLYFGASENFLVGDSSKKILSGVVLDINETTFLCRQIFPVYIIDEEVKK